MYVTKTVWKILRILTFILFFNLKPIRHDMTDGFFKPQAIDSCPNPPLVVLTLKIRKVKTPLDQDSKVWKSYEISNM